MINYYTPDQSMMFRDALTHGLTTIPHDCIVILMADDDDNIEIEEWCDNNMPNEHIVSCCFTVVHSVPTENPSINYPKYSYHQYYYFQNSSNALMFRLVFAEYLVHDFGTITWDR